MSPFMAAPLFWVYVWIARQWQVEQFLDVQVVQLDVVEPTAPSPPFVLAENPDIFFVSFFE